MRGHDLPGIRLGIVRGISYGLFGPPDEFIPQARDLGASLVRAYLHWGQIEPEPGRYVFDVVDALLAQHTGDEELWITIVSSSPWATRTPTNFLPASPAHEPARYAEFVRRLVAYCAGRVDHWQCDNEPSNTDLLWAGTADEYLVQLRLLHDAVRSADPAAAVVLGGCGYDVLSSAAGAAPRLFFDRVLAGGRDDFDLFSVHLYGDPTDIPAYLSTVREMMRAHGYERPVVVGEYGGPILFQFPDAAQALQQEMIAAFTASPAGGPAPDVAGGPAADVAGGPAPDVAGGPAAGGGGPLDPPERAVRALYARMDSQPPRLAMFLADPPAGLAERRDRIACRDLVIRTVLAVAGGVRRLAYWNLAPEVPGPPDRYHIMYLFFGKLALLEYDGRSLGRRHPAADTYELMATQLAGMTAVTEVTGPTGRDGVIRRDGATSQSTSDMRRARVYRVDRADRMPAFVCWEDRDPFDGEDQPATPARLPWPWASARAVDVFGAPVRTRVVDGHLLLAISGTPVFVTAPPR